MVMISRTFRPVGVVLTPIDTDEKRRLRRCDRPGLGVIDPEPSRLPQVG